MCQLFAKLCDYLSSVDEFIREALGDALDVPERRLPRARAQEPDGLVDSSQRTHVHRLTTHRARTTDPGRVLPGTAVDDRVHQDLERVLQPTPPPQPLSLSGITKQPRVNGLLNTGE